eukprot:11323503-Prorocentrum_lima.AAC.1
MQPEAELQRVVSLMVVCRGIMLLPLLIVPGARLRWALFVRGVASTPIVQIALQSCHSCQIE